MDLAEDTAKKFASKSLGVMPYAVDPEAAKRLGELCERFAENGKPKDLGPAPSFYFHSFLDDQDRIGLQGWKHDLQFPIRIAVFQRLVGGAIG